MAMAYLRTGGHKMALASSPTLIQLLGTVNADQTVTGVTAGVSIPIEVGANDELVFYFESSGATSGGTVLIEEASRANYTGTWSQIASVAASSFTGTVQLGYHLGPNAFGFVRVRISSAITGGGSILVFLKKQGS